MPTSWFTGTVHNFIKYLPYLARPQLLAAAPCIPDASLGYYNIISTGVSNHYKTYYYLSLSDYWQPVLNSGRFQNGKLTKSAR